MILDTILSIPVKNSTGVSTKTFGEQLTLYFCHFYWGFKTRVFNVYDSSLNYDYCLMTSKAHRTCYWEVRPDDF
ncbi:hypothetical protein RHMOL_Rhmol12G0246800 [Rhododendron molle]|uniref:Uncharacterized protein n=1 Tax=Rhododendron molle TaxID=49168 RepID=A0ACC0LN78_RHOML|nr:hypothetical protein RHMOL_Rhmol12G0246800 [Rhododendron molle]